MKRRLIYGFVILALGVNLFFGAHIYLSSATAAQKADAYPSMELFAVVMERIRKDYVDGQKFTYQDLVNGALKGMIDKLDPHSEFLDQDKYKELQNDTEGHFGGLGIVITVKSNFVTVVSPMEDSPGFKAGILSGDQIIKIDGRSTEKMGLQETVKNLRGDPGTVVVVTILRPSSGEVKDYPLTRAIIKVDMVKDINGKKEYPLGENKIGYIRLVQFGEKTGDDLAAALKKLKAQGMESLVLDLRWNPGGLLDQAVEVCEKFLPREQLIVSTEGRNDVREIHRAGGRGEKYLNMPIVVLVNLGSASASEIVAGCLQDCASLGVCKAILVGEKTFGKGSVQSILPLQDGTVALRLTTAKYYTPSHKVIHEHGISPDIYVPLTDEEEHDVWSKRVFAIETIDEKDRERIRNVDDPQLDRAMDLLKGIALYTERAPEKISTKKLAANPENVAEPR